MLCCPKGHHWEPLAEAQSAACPVCGAGSLPAAPTRVSSTDATLAPPPRAAAPSVAPADPSQETLAPPAVRPTPALAPADAVDQTLALPPTKKGGPTPTAAGTGPEPTLPLSLPPQRGDSQGATVAEASPDDRADAPEETLPPSLRPARADSASQVPADPSGSTLPLTDRLSKAPSQAISATDVTLDPTARSFGRAPASSAPEATEALSSGGATRPEEPGRGTEADRAEGETGRHRPRGTTQRAPGGLDTEEDAPRKPRTQPAYAGPGSGPAIPGYTILGELGRGGMGVVFKARQVGLNRLVALKMILSGSYAGEADLARFRLEAEAVAKLQHPYIVQIYEINKWEGRPFFALEFVDGGPLDKKLAGNPLPFRQAAELLHKLAQAMDYAHQRQIVHRDLKPPNIMLTADGTPKVTDFGLAKKLDEEDGQTRTGAIMGTPSYMPPEQAEGRTKELGPAVDIYALGAILYELLVGRPPFKGATVWDTLEQVRTQEPVYPSRLLAKVPRDLETICLKCLNKEAPKRYATAGALADDLRRYLDGEPILARPTPTWERAWKWARRRPVAAALAVVSTLFVVSLVAGGLAFGESQRRQAQEEARLRRIAEDEHRQAEENFRRAEENFRRAEENFQRARLAVDTMLTGVGQERLAHEPRMEKLRRELLTKAMLFYERFLEEKGDDPGVRWETARARFRVGDIRKMLGEQEAAEQDYAGARTALTDLLVQSPGEVRYRRDLATCENHRGSLLRDARRTPEAEQAFRAALALRQGLVEEKGEAEDRLELAAVANNLGILLFGAGRYVEAEPILRQTLRLRIELNEGSAEPVYRLELARGHNNLGLLLGATGRQGDAEQAFGHAQTVLAQLTADHPDVPDYRQELAITYNHLGNFWRDTQPKKAEKAYGESQRLREQLVADFPTVPLYRQELAASYHDLGLVRQAAGRGADAEKAYEKSLDVLEKLAADYPRVPDYRAEVAASYNNRGILLQTGNRLPDAEKAYRRGLEIVEKLVADHANVPAYQQELASTLQNLAALLQATSRPDEGLKHVLRSLELRRELAERYPKAPVYRKDLASGLSNLGVFWQRNAKASEAEKAYLEAVELSGKLADEYPPVPDYRHLLANASNNLGDLLRATNRPEEAEKAWRKGLGLLTALKNEQPGVPVYRQDLARGYDALAIFLAGAGRRQDAEDAWDEALTVQEKLVADFPASPVYRVELAKYHGNLGVLHAQADRVPRAAQSYRRAIDILEDLEKTYPDVLAYSAELTVPYSNLIVLLTAAKEPAAEVEQCWRRLLVLREKLAGAFPKVAEFQSNLAVTEHGLARFLLEGKQLKEARPYLEKAVRHQRAALEITPQHPGFRQQLGSHYLALAQTLVKLNDHAASAAAVAEWVQAMPAGWQGYHVPAAAVLARCVGVAGKDAKLAAEKRDELVKTYAERALDLLRQAITLGYKDVEQLKSAEDFAPLRSRDDFKKLLAGLEEKK